MLAKVSAGVSTFSCLGLIALIYLVYNQKTECSISRKALTSDASNHRSSAVGSEVAQGSFKPLLPGMNHVLRDHEGKNMRFLYIRFTIVN